MNYFTLNTIKRLLNQYDFQIIHHETTLFSGKALTVFAQKYSCVNKKKLISENEMNAIQIYQKNWPILKQRMQDILHTKNKTIVYGCGARSCTFVNFMELDMVQCYIDDQDEKQNLYVPGSKLKIRSWSDEMSENYFLLGVNTENEMKILQKRKPSKDQYISIQPPSRLLPNQWKELINA